MKIFLLLFFFTFTLGCFGQKPIPVETPPPPPKSKTIKYNPPKRSVGRLLEDYFNGKEIKPYIVVNNLENGPYVERGETEIPLGRHKVRWIKKERDTEVEIDGELITLKDKVSLSPLDGKPGEMDKVDFADDWNQAKLYLLNGREVIGISMGNTPCTGNGCSVTFFLIYDLQTKKAGFFGSYRIDYHLKLYYFGDDNSIDFLTGTYFDDAARESQKLFHFYSLNDQGDFVLQKNSKQQPYFIKRFFIEKNYQDKEIDSKFAHSWVEEIK